MTDVTNNENIRVLIVEDEPLVGEMLLGILESMQYKIAGIATNGTQAVEVAQTVAPDVILMDIGLTEIDGIEATRRIQQQHPTPIVILTAYDNHDMLERATEAGVGAYLIKPTNASSLKNAITTVIARFNDMMELRRLNARLQEEITVRQRIEEDRAQLLMAEREQRNLAETLTEVTLALTSQTDHEVILNEILNQARRIIPFDIGLVLLVDGPVLRAARWQGLERIETFIANLVLPLDEFPINAEVIQTRAPLVIGNVHQDPRWVTLEHSAWIQSTLLIPIFWQEQVLGILQFNSAIANAFSYEDAERLMPLASAAGIAIENARLMVGLETEVATRTAEIATERDKSDAILRNTADAIAVLDDALRVQYINPAFEQMTGHIAAESIGRNIHELLKSTLPPQGLADMRAAHAEGVMEWRGEPILMRKDGRTYEATMTISPIRDADEALLGYVISHQDISHFKSLDRARSQFITSISHELRTPLTVLDLSLRKLQRQIPPDLDQRAVTVMAAQIKQLIHFTEDILEMTALDSGKGLRRWDVTQLAALVTDTMRRYEGMATKHNVTLTTRPVPSDLPPIKGDQKRIAQMLGELVENAITFTPEDGEITLTVRTIVDETRTWITISVHDTGPGILPEERDKIFDRFFRGHLAESGHVLGTGLGLSIAQAIAQAHGGKITVESEMREGSIFTVWLPVAD